MIDSQFATYEFYKGSYKECKVFETELLEIGHYSAQLAVLFLLSRAFTRTISATLKY